MTAPESSSPDNTTRIVRCPACGGPSVYGPSNPYRPFCSERCKLQDLGAWASERYRMDVAENDRGVPSVTEQPEPPKH